MREEYDKVVAVEWMRSGIRSFFRLPHGGVPTFTYSLNQACKVTEQFWKACLDQTPALSEGITSWKLMSEDEALAWVKTWPWLPDGSIVPASIPYWE